MLYCSCILDLEKNIFQNAESFLFRPKALNKCTIQLLLRYSVESAILYCGRKVLFRLPLWLFLSIMTCKMFFCQSLCVYSIWLFSFCYFGLTHTARTGLIFATCAQDRATKMQQWSTLNNFIVWILPLHVCGSWLASSSSVFEKLPGRQPLKRSLLLSESICGKPLKRSLSLSESIYDTVIIRVHVWQTLNAIFVTKFQYHLIFNFTFSLMDTPNTTHSQSCKNVPTVPTSWCYFFWPVLIFGKKHAKNRRKHAKNRRKHAKTRKNRRKTGAVLVLMFLGGKLVGANFYAFCNYVQDDLS